MHKPTPALFLCFRHRDLYLWHFDPQSGFPGHSWWYILCQVWSLRFLRYRAEKQTDRQTPVKTYSTTTVCVGNERQQRLGHCRCRWRGSYKAVVSYTISERVVVVYVRGVESVEGNPLLTEEGKGGTGNLSPHSSSSHTVPPTTTYTYLYPRRRQYRVLCFLRVCVCLFSTRCLKKRCS